MAAPMNKLFIVTEFVEKMGSLGLKTDSSWGDVSPQHLNLMHFIFHHIGEKDQRLAYDHFFRELGRAPRVQEFSEFLLTFEGNDLTDSSRKTLGQLYLENKKSQKTLNQILQAMRQLKQMLRLMDSRNQALGQRNDQYKREMDNLQSENRNLEGTICNIQLQKEDLQLKFNSLRRRHVQHLAELEDERKDKQQLQADRQALQNTVTSQTDTITQQYVTITAMQQQNQRQQYFILFLAALIFAMVCFQFFS